MKMYPSIPTTSGSTHDKLSIRSLILCLFVTVIFATGTAVWPKAGQPVGVVFGPWVSAPDVMNRVFDAGGTIVDTGGVGNVVIAVSTSRNFHANLFSQGAFILLDGSLARSFCNPLRNK